MSPHSPWWLFVPSRSDLVLAPGPREVRGPVEYASGDFRFNRGLRVLRATAVRLDCLLGENPQPDPTPGRERLEASPLAQLGQHAPPWGNWHGGSDLLAVQWMAVTVTVVRRREALRAELKWVCPCVGWGRRAATGGWVRREPFHSPGDYDGYCLLSIRYVPGPALSTRQV